MSRPADVIGSVVGVLILFLTGCSQLFLDELDNPGDPNAESYQGYVTVSDPDSIEAVTKDGASLRYQTFLVNAVMDALSYKIEISSDSGFSRVLFTDDSVDSNHLFISADLQIGNTYYWRASAQGSEGWGEPTEVRSFQLQDLISTVSPENTASVDSATPSFEWSTVSDAIRYEIQIADSESAVESAIVIEIDGSTNTWVPDTALTNNAAHYWRIRPVSESGSGGWSETRVLTVGWGAITGMLPVDETVTADTTPEFIWDPVDDAVAYHLQYNINDEQFLDPVETTITAPDASYELPFELLDFDKLFWRVKAVDGDDQSGSWSSIHNVVYRAYAIGDTGPAGGIIFYDKGGYSDGWNYLEAASSGHDIDGDGDVDDRDTIGWAEWGNNDDIYMNNTYTAIGTGEANTSAIVSVLGDGIYAAKFCADLVRGGYDDWFLPSKDELELIYTNLYLNGLGSFPAYDDFWSSSEANSDDAWRAYFSSYSINYFEGYKGLDSGSYVRAVRSF